MTPGFALPARFVIHAVGPVWDPATPEKNARAVASCYRNALLAARDRGLASVAIPAISTGIYRYPLDAACAIAYATVSAFCAKHAMPGAVTLVAFDEKTERALERAARGGRSPR